MSPGTDLTGRLLLGTLTFLAAAMITCTAMLATALTGIALGNTSTTVPDGYVVTFWAYCAILALPGGWILRYDIRSIVIAETS